MKRELLRKIQFPIMLALGIYPLAACFLAFLAPELLRWAWVLPAAYVVLSMLLLLLPGKLRVLLSIGGALTPILLGCLLLQGMNRNVSIVISAIYGGLLLWSLQLPGWDQRREISGGWLSTCLTIVLAGCFVSWLEVRLAPVAGEIRLATFGFVFLAMLSRNRDSLNLASGNSRGFTAAMQRKNLLLTAGMFAIALAVALIPSLYNALAAVFAWILRLIQWLRALLASLMPVETTVETTTEATTVPLTTGEDWMGVVLEDKNIYKNEQARNILMTSVVLAVMIPGVLFVAYRLVKLLIKGIHRLAQLLDQAAELRQEEFIDEITDTREDVSAGEQHRKKQALRPKRTAPGKLSPRQRIRYRYRRMQERHPQWKAHNTARETLTEEAARLYERARYSDHPMTDDDAVRFQNETK